MKVVLIGKTGAGKTSIAKELEKLGYPRLITDTTRPMREGEKDGVDYNFIDIEQFLSNVRMKHYAEYTYFNTKFGRWYYGSKISSYDETGDKCIVLTPDGARSVLAMTNSRDDIFLSSILKFAQKRYQNALESVVMIHKKQEEDCLLMKWISLERKIWLTLYC